MFSPTVYGGRRGGRDRLLLGSGAERFPRQLLRVTTEPGLGRLDFVPAVADFNGDGRDDALV